VTGRRECARLSSPVDRPGFAGVTVLPAGVGGGGGAAPATSMRWLVGVVVSHVWRGAADSRHELDRSRTGLFGAQEHDTTHHRH